MSLSMPGDKALSWLLVPFALFGYQVFEFHVSAQPRQIIDLQPGAVLHGPHFNPEPCEGGEPAVGGLIAPKCVRMNRISASSYALDASEALQSLRQRRRERWARVQDDAVLVYCGFEWCRIVAVVPNRFAPDAAG